MNSDSFDALVSLLSGHKVYLQTHDFPDPDAIASAVGLQKLLKWKGIDAEVCYFGRIEKSNTKMIVEHFHLDVRDASELENLSEEDYVVTVDGQKSNSNFSELTGREVACIDHHPWTTEYAYEFVKHKITGACATIVTKWIKNAGMPLERELATLLLYGIKMDTRSFSFGVSEDDIEAFAFLNRYVDSEFIRFLDNSVLELTDLRAYGAAIENIRIYDDVGFAYIPFECPDGLIASVCEFILSLAVVQVAIVYAERSGNLKFSVRSETSELNAGRFLNRALDGIGSGGGHVSMAGGVVFAEKRSLLGEKERMEFALHERFLKVYREMEEEQNHV